MKKNSIERRIFYGHQFFFVVALICSFCMQLDGDDSVALYAHYYYYYSELFRSVSLAFSSLSCIIVVICRWCSFQSKNKYPLHSLSCVRHIFIDAFTRMNIIRFVAGWRRLSLP